MILYSKKGGITARNLARSLNVRAIKDSRWEPINGLPSIIWGTSLRIPNNNCEINNTDSIRNAANGLRSLNILRNAEIYVPNFWNTGRSSPYNTR